MIDNEMTLPEVARKQLNGRSPWQWLIDDLEKGCIPEDNELIEDTEFYEN